jgi:hypothetical protein
MAVPKSLLEARCVAVLTGDLVGSSRHASGKNDSRTAGPALEWLKDSLRLVAFDILHGNLIDFEIYRGDSFQGVVAVPDALYVALMVRMDLQARSMLGAAKSHPLDARIAIGIGEMRTNETRRSSEADGTAFRRSGPLLDSMQGKEPRLRFETPFDEVSDELNTEAALLDALVSKWSKAQVEAIRMHLLGMTQTSIAKAIGVSQPAIAKRLARSGVAAVDVFLKRYERLAKAMITEGYNPLK